MATTSDPDRVDRARTPNLSSFIMKSTGDHELAMLMNAIALACKAITRAVRKAGGCYVVESEKLLPMTSPRFETGFDFSLEICV